jgi:serine/threonine-protein kinase RsbT
MTDLVEVRKMAVENEGQVRIESEGDIVAVRKTVREEAVQMHFGVTDITRIVTAASELARNVYHYAGSGFMSWRRLNSTEGAGLELIFSDQGPGITDISKALEVGYTTRGGLGLGLPGAERLMDEMEIVSTLNQGTTVIVRKWLKADGSRR